MITGELPVIKEFLALLEDTIGKLKVNWNELTNCGIRHVQDPTTFAAIIRDQNRYVVCSKPISIDGVSASSGDALVSPHHKALFISPLGALVHTLLTRVDIA
eukprot:5771560-Lingulodinium_polyedra.AAC.1